MIVSNPLYAAVITATTDNDHEPGQPLDNGAGAALAARDEILEAQPAYDKAAAFYDGEIGDIFASEAVRRLFAKAGIAEVEDFNYAAVPVDTLHDRLRLTAISAARGDDTDNNQTPTGSAGQSDPELDEDQKDPLVEQAQVAINDLVARNQFMAEIDGLHLSALEFGDAYLFVWPVTDGETDDAADSDPDRADTGRVVSVDMRVNSPKTTRVFYDPADPLRRNHSARHWLEPDPRPGADGHQRHRITLYYPDDDPGGARVERWVTRVQGKPDQPTDWQQYTGDNPDEPAPWPLPNPTGRVPHFHYRTDRPYGKPVHRRAYGPQRLINKLIASHATTVDYQTFPQRYALTDPKADRVLGNLIDPDFPQDDEDDPENPGSHSQLRADPSAVWQIPGVTSVGQFGVADPGVFIQPIDRYVRAISELTATPLHKFGAGFSQPPTGESLRVAEAPTTKAAQRLQSQFGEVHADAFEFALDMLGIHGVKITTKWAPAESATGTDDWQIVGLKIDNGVPVKVALTEAGYPEEEVEKWLQDESGADLVRRVAILNSIGTAVQTLGAGVAAGIVSEEQVGDIVARVLGLSKAGLPALAEPVKLSKPQPPAGPGGAPPPQPPPSGGRNNGTAQPALPPLPAPPAPAPEPPLLVGTD